MLLQIHIQIHINISITFLTDWLALDLHILAAGVLGRCGQFLLRAAQRNLPHFPTSFGFVRFGRRWPDGLRLVGTERVVPQHALHLFPFTLPYSRDGIQKLLLPVGWVCARGTVVGLPVRLSGARWVVWTPQWPKGLFHLSVRQGDIAVPPFMPKSGDLMNKKNWCKILSSLFIFYFYFCKIKGAVSDLWKC